METNSTLRAYEQEVRTDPTYKEWKLYAGKRYLDDNILHGSYLQGMETAIN